MLEQREPNAPAPPRTAHGEILDPSRVGILHRAGAGDDRAGHLVPVHGAEPERSVERLIVLDHELHPFVQRRGGPPPVILKRLLHRRVKQRLVTPPFEPGHDDPIRPDRLGGRLVHLGTHPDETPLPRVPARLQEPRSLRPAPNTMKDLDRQPEASIGR